MTAPPDLRDRLALDRTLLANERTLLAYVRTALALVGGGVGLLQFFDDPATRIGGWALIAAGVLALLVGAVRFRAVRADICAARDAARPPL